MKTKLLLLLSLVPFTSHAGDGDLYITSTNDFGEVNLSAQGGEREGWQVQRRFMQIGGIAIAPTWSDWGPSTYRPGSDATWVETLPSEGHYEYRARSVDLNEFNSGNCNEGGACLNSTKWISNPGHWVESDRVSSVNLNGETYWRNEPTLYRRFSSPSSQELLYVYEGQSVVFYSPYDYSNNEYAQALEHLDACMDLYSYLIPENFPQWRPHGSDTFSGKGSLAVVEDTCGAGCGAAGRAETLRSYHDRTQSRVNNDLSNPLGWQVPYYEFGRGGNKSFYDALSTPEQSGVGSGFPHFMAHACMDQLGTSYEDQQAFFETYANYSFPENPPPPTFIPAYQELDLPFVEVIVRDSPELTLDEPYRGYPRGVNHVFSMIFTDLYQQYGLAYMQSFFAALSELDASTAQDVEENIFSAANSAYIATGAGELAADRLATIWHLGDDFVPEYDSQYPTMHLVGSHNGWNLTASPMALVADNLWEINIQLSTYHEFKFVPNNWSLSFGDNDGNGVADTDGGGNIGVNSGTTQYTIRFNDLDLGYSVEEFTQPQAPVADAGADITVRRGDTVTLDGSASYDADGQIVHYRWDNGFGEGQSVSRVMNSLGTTIVTLEVEDNDGLVSTDTVTINVVLNQRPIVPPIPAITVSPNESFTLTSSHAYDPDGEIFSYRWSGGNLGGELYAETLTTSISNVGSYTFYLRVTDYDNASSDLGEYTVIVSEDEPESVYPSMHLVGTHNSWSLTATPMELVADNVWEITLPLESGSQFKFVPQNWSLSFGDNDNNGICDSNGGGNIVADQGSANYTISFNENTLQCTYSAEAQPQRPVANAGNDQTLSLDGGSINLDGTASFDTDGQIVTYQWSQTSGPTVSLSGANTVTPQATVPTLTSPTTLTFSLVVTDNDELVSVADTVNVIIQDNTPVCNWQQLYVRGTHNSWTTSTPMNCVGEGEWSITVQFTSSSNAQFKFDRYGDWNVNYGENSFTGNGADNGTADPGGNNILVGSTMASNPVTITFNENSRYWSKRN